MKQIIQNTIEGYLIIRGQEKSSAYKEAQELANLIYIMLLRNFLFIDLKK